MLLTTNSLLVPHCILRPNTSHLTELLLTQFLSCLASRFLVLVFLLFHKMPKSSISASKQDQRYKPKKVYKSGLCSMFIHVTMLRKIHINVHKEIFKKLFVTYFAFSNILCTNLITWLKFDINCQLKKLVENSGSEFCKITDIQ